ncbi:Fungal specific transcription factor domain [Ceratobasidium sp. AG-Ba]|nr:Fungal specific transcription factor domain [Ceratobasidium sp. AG-Ba]QRW05260.1 Fungal specific transcription factor domain [Ceratobasidium sp. AG-Ba]
MDAVPAPAWDPVWEWLPPFDEAVRFAVASAREKPWFANFDEQIPSTSGRAALSLDHRDEYTISVAYKVEIASKVDVVMPAPFADVASLNATGAVRADHASKGNRRVATTMRPIAHQPSYYRHDRIDELQNKIASIESREKTPRHPHLVPSQATYSPPMGQYVQFSPSDYSTPGPSRSMFTSTSNIQQYITDYVASDCSSSSGSNHGYSPQNISRNSPDGSWDTPSYLESSPQLLDSQPSMLGHDGVISEQLADKIMFHFLTHRFRCGLLHVDRLQPNTLNAERHPALLAVSYLLGCFFCSDGSLAHLESAFVERTRRALEDAIDLTEDLSYAIDYLFASSMFAMYYYSKGRLLEGYHRAISAVRFAVNKGFHELQALSQDQQTIHDPQYQLALINQKDKVCAWWFTFFIDRWGSLLTGLPCGIADADIRTPWPQTLEEIIDNVHTNSVVSLYSAVPGIPDRASSPYYGFALKAIALLDRASVKASSADSMSPEVWAAEYSAIQGALSRFAELIQSMREMTGVQDGTVLSMVHIMVYAATCALHMPYIRQWAHQESKTIQRNHLRSICRDAASTAAAILRTQREATSMLIPVWQGLPLAALCEFLLQERDNLVDELDFTEQAEVDKNLDEMMGWMHEARVTFPVLGMQVDKLDMTRR